MPAKLPVDIEPMSNCWFLTCRAGAPLLQAQDSLAVLFVELLVVGGGRGVHLPVPLLELSDHQLHLLDSLLVTHN